MMKLTSPASGSFDLESEKDEMIGNGSNMNMRLRKMDWELHSNHFDD